MAFTSDGEIEVIRELSDSRLWEEFLTKRT
jgi:hypothetical protein